MNRNSFCVVISAPSGTGKTTIIRRLLEKDPRFEYSISTTTRQKRQDEIEDLSYYFSSVDDFKKNIDEGEFFEWAFVHGNYYGTAKKEIDRIEANGKIPLLDIDVQGGNTIRERLDSAVLIFLVPPSFKILAERLRNRKTESEEQIKVRLSNAVDELKQYKIYDYIITNDTVDKAVADVLNIVNAELHKKSRLSRVVNKLLEEANDYTAR